MEKRSGVASGDLLLPLTAAWSACPWRVKRLAPALGSPSGILPSTGPLHCQPLFWRTMASGSQNGLATCGSPRAPKPPRPFGTCHPTRHTKPPPKKQVAPRDFGLGSLGGVAGSLGNNPCPRLRFQISASGVENLWFYHKHSLS